MISLTQKGNELSVIEIKNKQILIDGKSHLIMCGEIHYFRLKRSDWQDRIDKLKSAGCNAVASYVPWLCHEPLEGHIDLVGSTLPELDLGAFIDLCHSNSLFFLVRPGPFIMAELKNEGLPQWVYEKHPEIIPYTWDGRSVPTKTLDYLAPAFLEEAHKWYSAVMPIIASRLYTIGGNIIGVQLDNEIGMLSWVSNSPDLTDNLLNDFTEWLKKNYDFAALTARYPFSFTDDESRNKAIRSPEEIYCVQLHQDLGHYMRNRFARYVSALREYSEEFGVTQIPFIVNIHGTSSGRGLTFPIGISQLYESYTQSPGYISGSDIYFEDLTIANFQDLYLINSFMDAVHSSDQPLTSIEFNCGDGNFGNTYGGRYDPSAVDFKTRMCIAQGNRMLNYYLFAGGINYRMDQRLGDGNDRISFTGQRHGFAAPVNPEGQLNYTFPRMARTIQTMMAVADKLSAMKEEHDDVSFAFIPDYFMTEYHYPGSAKMDDFIHNLQANRAAGAWDIIARSMLLSCYRFGSTDIQNRPLSPTSIPVLVIASARYMHGNLQEKLSEYLRTGGGLFLYGEIPLYDMEGRPCSILADALRVKHLGFRHASESFYLSLYADSWAAPRPEVRTNFAQVFEVDEAFALLRVYGTDEVCGFETRVGEGKAIVIATAYECDVSLFAMALERLGTRPALTHDCQHVGVFLTSTATPNGERFLHILNLDGFAKELHLFENGQALLDGRKIVLQSREGIMIPCNVTFADVKIIYSTAEILKITRNSIEFRLTQSEDVIALETDRMLAPSKDYVVQRNGKTILLKSSKDARIDDHLSVHFAVDTDVSRVL